MKVDNEERIRSFNRSIIDHRKKLNEIKPLTKPADIPHQNILILLEKNFHVNVVIYRPKNISFPCPTIFFIPGTAFVAKEFAFTHMICTYLAEQSGCQVIVINHRLAPEHPFPTALNDVYKLVCFIMRAPDSLFKIDKTKVVIMGYSSGGNLATTIAVRGKEKKLPIALQILISPLVDLSRSLKQYKKDFEDKDTVISDAFVEWFLNLYLPKGIDSKYPWLSPFWHKSTYLKRQPATAIIFGEYDRFRSDSEAYCRKLGQLGVNVQRWMLKGADHSFLWYKLEIVKTIGFRIKEALGLIPIDKPLSLKKEIVLSFFKSQRTLYNLSNDNSKNKQALKRKYKL